MSTTKVISLYDIDELENKVNDLLEQRYKSQSYICSSPFIQAQLVDFILGDQVTMLTKAKNK